MRQLAGRPASAPEFFAAFLARIVEYFEGLAAAVWLRGAQGHFQLQQQHRLENAGFRDEQDRHKHNELLRYVVQKGRALGLPPSSAALPARGPVNPSPHSLLVAPVRIDDEVVGVIEVWLEAAAHSAQLAEHARQLGHLSGYAAEYLASQQRRQILGQQQLWQRLEDFAHRAHSSLRPEEVAYLIAGEGRRMVDCDRVSVGVRAGKRVRVEAVSGVERVEARSNLIQRQRRLFETVLRWGEILIYTGARDESLPPAVLQALDDYLAESMSKLLVLLPLRDERETTARTPIRSGLLIESFDPTASVHQLVARLESIARPAASALYNATEYRRIPGRWLWYPLACFRDGLGGTARATASLAVLLVAGLIALLVLVQVPLKVEAKGQLLPRERRWVYSPVEGEVIRIAEGVEPGGLVAENQSLVLLYDMQLEIKLVQLDNEIAGAQQDVAALARQLAVAATEADRLRFSAEKKQKEYQRERKILERRALRERVHADETRPGYFWLRSPFAGTVLNWDFREKLINRHVKPSEPLLRIGARDQSWEVELRIPQKQMAPLLQALAMHEPGTELDVDLLLASAPTRTFRGKLAHSRVAAEALPDGEAGESGPAVFASVRIDGPDLPPEQRIPPDLLVTGIEVHSRLHCGDRALGYSWFHGLWEFFYEKVLFF